MALTKIRAEQISDIDFKQAVRVVATTNVTLTNGAVDTIDSVLLAVSDRVLVTAQSTASQNGLYRVSVLGTGANGTWVRSSDGDATGDMSAGMLVSVTEGTVYKDTQWQLTTDNPIVLATTSLVFAQTSSGGGHSGDQTRAPIVVHKSVKLLLAVATGCHLFVIVVCVCRIILIH